jgi:chromosome segregation ATPase
MGAATLNTMMRMGQAKLEEDENEKLKANIGRLEAKIAENGIYVKSLESNLDVISRAIKTWENQYKDLTEQNGRLEAGIKENNIYIESLNEEINHTNQKCLKTSEKWEAHYKNVREENKKLKADLKIQRDLKVGWEARILRFTWLPHTRLPQRQLQAASKIQIDF